MANTEKDPATAEFYRAKANSYADSGFEIAHPTSSEDPRKDRFETLEKARGVIDSGRKAGVIKNPLKD
jgi:hypothetical protein